MLFAGLVTSWGAAFSRWLVAPRVPGRRRTLVATARNVGLAGATTAVADVGLVFWRQLRDFRDPLAPWAEDAAVLLGTDWGTSWRLAAAGAPLALLAFALAKPDDGGGSTVRRAAWGIATPLAAAMCAFPAFTGHAAGTESMRWISIPADILHVLAAGSWIGGLVFVLAAERRERRRTGRSGALFAEIVPRYTPGGARRRNPPGCDATGVFASWLHATSPHALVSTRYGRILLIKMALAVGVAVLGAVNWRRLAPRLRDVGGAGSLRRNAIRELVVARLVILATALLVRTSPLGG